MSINIIIIIIVIITHFLGETVLHWGIIFNLF